MLDRSVYRGLLAILAKQGTTATAVALVTQASPDHLAQLAQWGRAVQLAVQGRADARVWSGLPDPLGRPVNQVPPARSAPTDSPPPSSPSTPASRKPPPPSPPA